MCASLDDPDSLLLGPKGKKPPFVHSPVAWQLRASISVSERRGSVPKIGTSF